MSDEHLYDLTPYDRGGASEETISLSITSIGTLNIGIALRTPTNDFNLLGTGKLIVQPLLRQAVQRNFLGAGDIRPLTLVFRRTTAAPLGGHSALIPNITVKTPMALSFSGGGVMTATERIFLLQHMRTSLMGYSGLDASAIMQQRMLPTMRGNGDVNLSNVRILLLLNVLQQGAGSLILRRLGGLNENTIELLGLNLLPGQTLTIDTDLMQVLINSKEDVSAVTSTSVFFELNPGENLLTVGTDANQTVQITAIWQNRWL